MLSGSLTMNPRSDLDGGELNCRAVNPMCVCRRLRLAEAAPQGPDDAGGAVRYALTVRSTHAATARTVKAVMMSYGMVCPLSIGVCGRTRTCNLRALYPVELYADGIRGGTRTRNLPALYPVELYADK